MYTLEQAIEFGRASAAMALDQWREHGNVQDAVDSYRDNVRDTLNDERSAQHEWAAWEAFDAYVSEHRASYDAAAEAAIEQAIEQADAEEAAAYGAYEAWCEAGGYASGLARPVFRASDCIKVEEATQEAEDNSEWFTGVSFEGEYLYASFPSYDGYPPEIIRFRKNRY